MEYKLENIIERYNKKEKLSFLFFWGHRANPDGSISNGCFSQWWPCKFEVDGIVYNCAEQYMMAEKARLFPDNEKLLISIMNETDPSKHKKYGRMVKNYNDNIWNAKRKDVVLKGNMAKFSQNEDLKKFLLSPEFEGKDFVEGSPFDGVWGVKMDYQNPDIDNEENWQGQNLLGKVLGEVRDRLKNEKEV